MAKPGKIKYDFESSDNDPEFQEFLKKKPSCVPAEKVDMEKFKRGVDLCCEKFL